MPFFVGTGLFRSTSFPYEEGIFTSFDPCHTSVIAKPGLTLQNDRAQEPSPPDAVHDRGSNGARAWVGGDGAARMAESVDGGGVADVVGVVAPLADEVLGARTEKSVPVTTVTSDPPEVEPTPMTTDPARSWATRSAAAS